MEPGVHHAHFDQAIDPFLREQIVEVAARQAGANARENLVIQAVLYALQGLAQDIAAAAALVADDFAAFHADQWRHVAQAAQAFRFFIGDELAVGENLEVAIGVRFEQLEELRVHERLAADDAEEDVAHCLRFAHQLVERFRLHRFHFCRDIDPAALAAQIAGIDD